MTHLIRHVQTNDYEQWLPLWHGYNAFYGRVGATALEDQITLTTWLRFLNPDEPMHALIAFDGTQAIGLAHFIFHRSTTLINNTCYLQDLFVMPEQRGRGIARCLIENVYNAAQQQNSKRVYWQTHESNTNAMQLYDRVAEKSGFIVYRKLFD